MIFTHTGLMGDFVQTWPIASWYYKQTGKKITFVLADVPCFKDIDQLLLKQPFTERLIKVPHVVEHFGRGGQPYKFNPSDFGVHGEYINLGFRGWPEPEVNPRNWAPYYVADEYGFDVDLDYVIEIDGIPNSTDDIIINTFETPTDFYPKLYNDGNKKSWGEFMLLNYKPSRGKLLTPGKGLYYDLQLMKNAQHTYTSEGGMSVILDLMDINYTVYYKERDRYPGWWFELVYYKPNNSKRHFIGVPEHLEEPKVIF